MIKNIYSRIKTNTEGVFKNTLLRTVIVICLIAIIGLSNVNNYGVSWDEPLYVKHVLWNYELIRTKKPFPPQPSNIKYYGVILDAAAETLFQLKNGLNSRIEVNADRIIFKHLLTFLFSLFAYVSVAGMVGILCGLEYAWLGPIVLALFPGFWGHNFFNSKDIPFASLFTLSTWMGAYLVNLYSKLDRVAKFRFNRSTIAAILFGILIGFCTSVRIGGFVFLAFIPFTYIVTKIGARRVTIDAYRNIFICWILIFIPWSIITTLCHPISWSNPVGWFLENIKYNSQHGWGGSVLFNGHFFSGHQLPWYYIPRLVIITVPEIFQVFFILGLALCLYKYLSFSLLKKACLILVLLQVFSLPIYASIKGATMYDGMRQFLFIFPGIAVISASSIVWLWKKITRKSVRLFIVTLIASLFLQIFLDMIALHPYEYIYFNRLSGGVAEAHHRDDAEYWGLSLREAMEWVNNNSRIGTQVLVGGPLDSAKLFAKPGLILSSGVRVNPNSKVIEELRNQDLSRPYYYLAISRWTYQEAWPECKEVYKVVRQNVPLTIVKKCD